jgi:hypothetical protein
MTSYPGQRYLLDVQSKELVEAEIFDQITAADIDEWRTSWKPEVDRVVAELASKNVPKHLWPQSHHWDWANKVPSAGVIFEKGYSLRCKGRLQGLMRVNSVAGRCRIQEQLGVDCIYVDFIEAAPWNQVQYTHTPRYTLVGTMLIAAAIHQSIDEGFKGRFGLHSLPQSNNWYAHRLGMMDLGFDQDRYQGRLKYFEATAETAASLLNGVKFS